MDVAGAALLRARSLQWPRHSMQRLALGAGHCDGLVSWVVLHGVVRRVAEQAAAALGCGGGWLLLYCV